MNLKQMYLIEFNCGFDGSAWRLVSRRGFPDAMLDVLDAFQE